MGIKRRQFRRLIEISVILVFSLFLLYAISGVEAYEDVYEEYNQGWELSYGEVKKVIDLPQNSEIEPNTIYTIRKKLPKNLLEEQAIVFRSRHQKVEVYVDGVSIYRYPKIENKWDLDSRNWNFVDLPEESGGKFLEIRFSSKYRNFSGDIGEIYLGDLRSAYYYIREKTSLTFFLSAMIGVIGSAFWTAIFLFYPERRVLKKKEERERILKEKVKNDGIMQSGEIQTNGLYDAEEMLAILLITVSIWLCGESHLPVAQKGIIGLIAPTLQDFFTFLALLLIPVFFEAYICRKLKAEPRKSAIILFRISTGVCIASLGMQFLGLRDLVELLNIGMIMVAIVFLHGIYVIGAEVWKKKGTFGRADLIFIIVIGICIMYEMLNFYFDEYVKLGIYTRTGVLLYAFYMLVANIRKTYLIMKENKRLSAQLQERRVELMMSQIRPHFIYNTLNSIRTLVKVSPDEACDMIYDFSNYLRTNIDFISEQKEILFSEEEAHIKAYANIEQRRFGKRLLVKYDIRAKDFYLPMLSVQPLVENAIKHGVCKKPKGGTVTVRTYESENMYFVEVEDDGIGFDTKQCYENGNSTGLRNIRFRLRTISSADLHIESEIGKGTKVVITIPKDRNIEESE